MKRICVVGNSYIGALGKAWEKERLKRKDFIMDFYGNAGGGIKLLRVEDGILKGIRYSSNKTKNVNLKEYELFLIFCDLFIPNYIRQTKMELSFFSRQVIEETIKDRADGLRSIELLREITKITSAPIYIASKPVRPGSYKISEDEYSDALNVISKIIQPAIYVEPPLSILDENFSGNDVFFKDSVYIDGRTNSQDTHPHHDVGHMNENGGRELLLHFLNKIENSGVG